VRPAYDAQVEHAIRTFFDRYSTVSFGNYAVETLRDAPAALQGGR
jgi:hypothetical protein